MSIELISGTPAQLPQINQLSKEVWGYPMAEAHLHWRYFENPVDDACITLALDTTQNKIVGFYAAIPIEMQLGKQNATGAQVIDTMVHPDFQGKGLFGKMGDHCFAAMAQRGYEVLYGFPNDNAYGGCINRLNWHHTGQIATYARPLKWFGRLLMGAKAHRNILREKAYITMLDAFFLKAGARAKHTLGMARSGAWLHWRYDARGIRHFSDTSKRAYFWHCRYNEQGELSAFCVWGILDAGDATLCEWHGLNAADKKAVLQDAIHLAQSKGLRLFRAYRQTPNNNEKLWHFGFLKLPKRFSPRFIVRHLSANNPGGCIHRHECWRVTGGDMDTQ